MCNTEFSENLSLFLLEWPRVPSQESPPALNRPLFGAFFPMASAVLLPSLWKLRHYNDSERGLRTVLGTV